MRRSRSLKALRRIGLTIQWGESRVEQLSPTVPSGNPQRLGLIATESAFNRFRHPAQCVG
ncbi:hypothetical protein RISK_003459 [Rhodopirellula islandica]|uniref:Uncharacterized protein n=1 Tax=Rhodopirellula islandica TaxID=595434 RepID=A0A0J1BCT2_RHOIS|nr:hypothetical protein RISK_003459 [Rhodopirellula islandica]